jgi:hypothetical protein
MGINDLGGSYARGDLDTLLLRIMDSYFGQLQILYNAGSLSLVSLLLHAVPFYPFDLDSEC